jgi:drug/metabolite transporter (DMT)-like permease
MRILGFVLIVLGIIMIVIRGFNVPVKKNVVDIGPLEINRTENKWIGWPTYVGGFMAVVGVILVVSDRKRG